MIKYIEIEYKMYLDQNIDNILKFCKINKNSQYVDGETLQVLITKEYTRHKVTMFERINNSRIQIKELMIYIENYISKLNNGQSNHNFYN